MNVNRIHKSYICKICGVTKGVRQCKCQRVFYCSKDCQLVDWKEHKTDCQQRRMVTTTGSSNANNISSNKSPTQLEIENPNRNMPQYYRYEDSGGSQGIQNIQPSVSPCYQPTQMSPVASSSNSLIYDGMGQQQYQQQQQQQQYKYIQTSSPTYIQQPSIVTQCFTNSNAPFTNSYTTVQPLTSPNANLLQNSMQSTKTTSNSLYSSPTPTLQQSNVSTTIQQPNYFNLIYPIENNEQKRVDNYNQFDDRLRAETTHNLDIENLSKSLSLDCRTVEDQQQSNYNISDDQLFDESLLQVIENFNFEDPQLLQATKDDLEQELLQLVDQQAEIQINNNNNINEDITIEQISSNNLNIQQQQLQDVQQPQESGPINDQDMALAVDQANLDDQTLFNQLEEQFNLEETCHNLIKDLNRYGVCVMDDFLGQEKGLQILEEVETMHSAGMFKEGQLVNAKHKHDSKRIRGDKIAWLSGKEPGASNIAYLINQVDSVVTMANRMRNNGILCKYNLRERTKAMVACYEGSGTHYVKHVDNPNNDGRCITAIYYLNLNWDIRESGGLLRIFPEHLSQVVDIEPFFDRILFFWSDRRNPHEVQSAYRTRFAITLWYFDQNERDQAVKKYQRDCTNNLVMKNT